MHGDVTRPWTFYAFAAFFTLFVLFLYGPMIVIYIVFNRQIVEGITAGSVK